MAVFQNHSPFTTFGDDGSLAARITRRASQQTFFTIRFLVDRNRVHHAYRAYGYFRWLDDQLDQNNLNRSQGLELINRQKMLIQAAYAKQPCSLANAEEQLLVDLIRSDPEPAGGIHAYIEHMMEVMAFDVNRRGQLISASELASYTHHLAVAVTEALHYFIGHSCKPPCCAERYHAVTAAHIAHMLRDTLEDTRTGYYNIPQEYLGQHHLDPQNVTAEAYRQWIRQRVRKAQCLFQSGERYLSRVKNLRCRVAGFAYIARFTSVLNTLKQEDFLVRDDYPECKSASSALKMVFYTLHHLWARPKPQQDSSLWMEN